MAAVMDMFQKSIYLFKTNVCSIMLFTNWGDFDVKFTRVSRSDGFVPRGI